MPKTKGPVAGAFLKYAAPFTANQDDVAEPAIERTECQER